MGLDRYHHISHELARRNHQCCGLAPPHIRKHRVQGQSDQRVLAQVADLSRDRLVCLQQSPHRSDGVAIEGNQRIRHDHSGDCSGQIFRNINSTHV